jgi:hypothetical protein
MVNSLESLAQVDDMDKFVDSFSQRYKSERRFRDIIHTYFNLKGFEKLSLDIGGFILPGWYKRKTDEMIKEYAGEIRRKAVKAREIKEQIARIRKAEEDLRKKEQERREAETKYFQAQSDYENLQRQKESEKSMAQQELNGNISVEERKRREAETNITKSTDAEEIARQHLIQFAKRSSLVRVKDDGSFVFNETNLMKKLEDIFLEEIVEGIEKEDGSGGFVSKTKQSYDGTIAYFAEVEDLSELPNVDWHQSIIYSRSMGFRYPRFPYLISGKFEGKGKTSLDTAIIFDRSGSMEGNGRIDAARKTALATSALMRKLNPKNETFLACYNGGLNELTPKEVLSIQPDDGTDTALAMSWLLNKLKNRGPSFAYLITDGLPNSVDETVKVAREFQKYPNIMLRMFLVDGNEQSKDIIRTIGRAAGPDTKVVCVDNYQLAGGAIRDLSSAIKQMQYASTI